ncbi:MAG TPA: ring-opening amidohydrolase [Bacillota bacterium]|jgi:cyanuric acid amidohydrolase|nr:ring-opening amidohydrolase [Bacillota bacterium]
MLQAKVFRVEMSAPDDVSGLEKLIESGEVNPEEVVAVLGKTEGNGCVNDFTRGFSTRAYKDLLAGYLKVSPAEVERRVAFVMSGGTEGVMTPHATIFTQGEVEAAGAGCSPGWLAIGISFTRDFLPEELGTIVQVEEVARAVEVAMARARIDSTEDVHFVQIKCPLLTSETIRDAVQRGKKVVVEDTYKSMGFSRAASALGVALALGEVAADQLSDEKIASDWSLFSSVASTSAGVELNRCEIILMGNSRQAASDYVIGHSVMKDAIDIHGVLEALRNAGLEFTGLPGPEQVERIVNVFAKAEADPTGYVRGRRNTMLTDSDINHTRHARAVVNAVIAAVVGDPMVYVSGGAEHQGPAGGGPVAVILRV